MFFTIPVNDKQIITTTPIEARSITHVFFENKNDGVFTYKRDIDTVTISIDGKMICRQIPIMPFCTSTPYGVNQNQWQDKALEVNVNVNISEIKISAGNVNDFNIVFVCSDKTLDEAKGFDFVEAKRVQITKAMTTEEAKDKLSADIVAWRKEMEEAKAIIDKALSWKPIEDVNISDYNSTCSYIRISGKDKYVNIPISDSDENYEKLCELLKKGIRFSVNKTDNSYCQLMSYQVNIGPTANAKLPYNIYYEDKYNALDYGCNIPDMPYKETYKDVNDSDIRIVKSSDGSWHSESSSLSEGRDWREWRFSNSNHVVENLPGGNYILNIEVTRTTTDSNQGWQIYNSQYPNNPLYKNLNSESFRKLGVQKIRISLPKMTTIGIQIKSCTGSYKISLEKDNVVDAIKRNSLNDVLLSWGREINVKLDKAPERFFAFQVGSMTTEPTEPKVLFTEDIALNMGFSGIDNISLPSRFDTRVIEATDDITWQDVAYEFEDNTPKNFSFFLDFNKDINSKSLDFTNRFTSLAEKPYTWDFFLVFLYKKVI